MYQDARGEFAIAIPLLIWGVELALPALSTLISTAAYSAGAAAIAYAGYKAIEAVHKNTEVYAPDRPLPVTEHGVPLPEADAPHTQLGTRDGRKGKYPQAREFDAKGKPLKDIDFTDHGKPKNHPNPHQHRREENATGGTRSREDAEPLLGWKY
ncbi:MAG: hypothetical protein EBR39_07010 [Betaproteobacteria bacterium]|nr:hypothetical protein [Betaproteobacteria bacterium]